MCRSSQGKKSLTESKVGQAAAVLFNNISYGIPVVSPKKCPRTNIVSSCFIQIIKPSFIVDNSEYSVRLNCATSGTKWAYKNVANAPH
nr:11373_t:CDS:2 [Entrophospora candida]